MEEFLKANIFQVISLVFLTGMFYAGHQNLVKRFEDFRTDIKESLKEKVNDDTCKARHGMEVFPFIGRDLKK